MTLVRKLRFRAVFALLAAVLGVAGCAATPRVHENPELPPGQPSPAPIAQSVANEAQSRARYAQALALADQTSVLIPGWAEAAMSLAQARALLLTREWDAAILQSDEATARAEAALSDHYARLANEELRKAYDYTGLGDSQLLELQGAEEILVTGNSRLAYGRLRQFNERVARIVKPYAVRPGDSLWVIASKPGTYANPWLWPLIWQDNLAVLPDPNRVRAGQVLTLRPHPRVNEVVKAIQHSRGKVRRVVSTPRIGEIREAR